MTALDFERYRKESSAAPWNALDRAVARWVRAHGGDALLASVAAWASHAESLGDVALPLQGDAARSGWQGLDAAGIATLRRSNLVDDGDAHNDRPFVVDAWDRFYLRRNHEQEQAVAGSILERLSSSVRAPIQPSDVELLFDPAMRALDQAQRDAVLSVPDRGLFVLTGGPGTGKTRTIVNMLLMLARQATPGRSIALTAPTGKAAHRLRFAVQQGCAQRLSTLPLDWQSSIITVAAASIQTLHRLLEFEPAGNFFRRNARNPLDADIVVVDEASMMDLALLSALLSALPERSCLILVGDANQLTSVAAGSVFEDLVRALQTKYPDKVVTLTHSFRASSALGAINATVVAGDRTGLHAALRGAETAARRYDVLNRKDLAVQAERWAESLAADLMRSTCDSGTPIEQARLALRQLSRRQILCALNRDALGAQSVNHLVISSLKRQWGIEEDRTWFAGRAVLVLRNDYALGLFNGDIGVALADGSGQLQVWFESSTPNGALEVRAFNPSSLPEHESAFAITIHKSQGSEYDEVAVVLPGDQDHRILSRQLIYTALSRARHRVEIWGSEPVLDAGIDRVAMRHGGLETRLTSSGVDPE